MLPPLRDPKGHILPALVRSSLTTPAHLQTPHFSLGPEGWRGAALTRIYYKADPINGDGGLGDVGGEDAFPNSRGGHIKYLGGRGGGDILD